MPQKWASLKRNPSVPYLVMGRADAFKHIYIHTVHWFRSSWWSKLFQLLAFLFFICQLVQPVNLQKWVCYSKMFIHLILQGIQFKYIWLCAMWLLLLSRAFSVIDYRPHCFCRLLIFGSVSRRLFRISLQTQTFQTVTFHMCISYRFHNMLLILWNSNN